MALRLKSGGLFAVLLACVAGLCVPMMARSVPALRADRELFFVLKSFAAGVMLATGFVHILPDSFDSLTNPCLQGHLWARFPFAGFISMLAALLTLMAELWGAAYYHRKEEIKQSTSETLPPHMIDQALALEASPPLSESKTQQTMIEKPQFRHRVIAQVLEFGIVAHSVIIGISLGTSQSTCTIKPLVAALTFHQFFEGLALGGSIVQAEYKSRAAAFMGFVFSISSPTGIAVGIGIASTYNGNSPTALIVEGLFDSMSSGILIYMSLVDLIAADFRSDKMLRNPKLQFQCYSALFLGAGAMSLVANWA